MTKLDKGQSHFSTSSDSIMHWTAGSTPAENKPAESRLWGSGNGGWGNKGRQKKHRGWGNRGWGNGGWGNRGWGNAGQSKGQGWTPSESHPSSQMTGDNLEDEWLEDDLQEAFVPTPWKGSSQIYQAIEKSLVRSNQNRRKSTGPTTRRSVIFSNGRREHVLHSLGYPPLFYPRTLTHHKPKQEQVHLYIDVSGSMLSNSVLHFIFGLTLHLKDELGPHLYQFTTCVRTVTIEQIKRGQLITGGTEINPVIQHALDHQFQRILIVTDGCFSPVSSDLLYKARQNKLYIGVLLTEFNRQQWKEEDLFEVWDLTDDLQHFDKDSFHASSSGGVGSGGGHSSGGWGKTQTKKEQGQQGEGVISLPMATPIQIKWGCSGSQSHPLKNELQPTQDNDH